MSETALVPQTRLPAGRPGPFDYDAYLPPINPKAVEQALLIGDLSHMSDEVRIAYYVATCRSLGLNPLTKPFQALKNDDGKVTLYPDKGCAEQLRKLHRVSIRVVDRQVLDDLYIVTVRATTPDGREEESQGIVPIAKAKGIWEDYEYHGQPKRRFKPAYDAEGQEITVRLSGTERATALMKAETKAKRRVTLAICGLGLPDAELEDTGHPMALSLHAEEKTVDAHSADLFGDQEALYAGLAVARHGDRPTPDDGTTPGGLTYLKEKLEAERSAMARCRAAIEAQHTHAGRDEAWCTRYWTKMRRRFSVSKEAPFTLEHLEMLEQEVRQFYVLEEARESQEGMSESGTTLPASQEEERIVDDAGGKEGAFIVGMVDWPSPHPDTRHAPVGNAGEGGKEEGTTETTEARQGQPDGHNEPAPARAFDAAASAALDAELFAEDKS